jgi:hypothetical protein
MNKISINELKDIVRRKINDEYAYFSNLWKNKNEQSVCIGIYSSGNDITKGYYKAHVVMNYSGEIIRIKDRYGDCEELSFLLNKKIDLNSFEYDYEKVIKDRPVGVESSNILGTINSKGNVKIYAKRDVANIRFSETYKTNNLQGFSYYGNYHLVDIFKNIVKNYENRIEDFSIHNDGITYYNVFFKIKDFHIYVTLSQFFKYELEVKIFKNQDPILLKLTDELCSNLKNILRELKSNKLSNKTKSMILLTREYQVDNFYMTNGNQDNLDFNVSVSDLNTTYKFHFDYSKNKITCSNIGRSKKKIPKIVKHLNEEMRRIYV